MYSTTNDVVKKHRATLAKLEEIPEGDRDDDLYLRVKKKLDDAIGRTKNAAGEEREGAQVYQIMGALKRNHATEMELRLKNEEKAQAALQLAHETLTKAKTAKDETLARFENRRAMVAGWLSQYDVNELEGGSSTGEATNPLMIGLNDPTLLSAVMSKLVGRVQTEHSLEANSVQIQSMNHLCKEMMENLCSELQVAANSNRDHDATTNDATNSNKDDYDGTNPFDDNWPPMECEEEKAPMASQGASATAATPDGLFWDGPKDW